METLHLMMLQPVSIHVCVRASLVFVMLEPPENGMVMSSYVCTHIMSMWVHACNRVRVCHDVSLYTCAACCVMLLLCVWNLQGKMASMVPLLQMIHQFNQLMKHNVLV